MAKGIWVFAEVKDGNIRKITFELLSQGKKMAEKLGEELVAVLLGSGVEGLTGRLSEYADKVFWADDPALAQARVILLAGKSFLSAGQAEP